MHDVVHLGNGTAIGVTGLKGGMSSGKPSVMLRFDLPPEDGFPQGRVVLAETSLALFLMAADGLKARFGDPRT